MRCYIKVYIYAVGIYGNLNKELFNKIYQGEDWQFTGRIKYQRDAVGCMRVSFGVFMLDDTYKEPHWYESYDFDFDDSSDAVIVDCNTK